MTHSVQIINTTKLLSDRKEARIAVSHLEAKIIMEHCCGIYEVSRSSWSQD